METAKSKKKRALFDRRSGQDRRKAYNIDYFLKGGAERRNAASGDRRNQEQDRRREWIKISPWSSLNAEGEDPEGDNHEEPLIIE